jgi:hypothetical protein
MMTTTYLHKLISQFLQLRIVVRLDHIIVMIELAEVKCLFHHLSIFGETCVVFLGTPSVSVQFGEEATYTKVYQVCVVDEILVCIFTWYDTLQILDHSRKLLAQGCESAAIAYGDAKNTLSTTW